MHSTIEQRFPFPAADILIHTGDFSDHGTPSELASFVLWLQSVGPRFEAVVLIPGNHDWRSVRDPVNNGSLSAEEVVAPGYYRRLLSSTASGDLPPNCFVLDHEEVVLKGLRIWGSAWCPWNPDNRSDGIRQSPDAQQLFTAWQARGGSEAHRFGEIPAGVDILLTHGPASRIMDSLGEGRRWGSSEALLTHIQRAGPRVHLFGHLHEQRGEWRKDPAGGYRGGIEYRVQEGGPPFPTTGPPPHDYPCEIVSCNAMANHPGLEQSDTRFIAGPARLILVEPRGAVPAAEPEAEPILAAGELPGGSVVGTRVLVRNRAHDKILAAPDGQKAEMRPEGTSEDLWHILNCPHEPGSVYFVHCATQKCLDTQGQGPAEIWNGGQTLDDLIAGNVSPCVGNLRWRILPCPHESGTSYIVHTRHGKFLDTHGHSVTVWNNNGKDVDTVIRENTSRFAGNLRWVFEGAE